MTELHAKVLDTSVTEAAMRVVIDLGKKSGGWLILLRYFFKPTVLVTKF